MNLLYTTGHAPELEGGIFAVSGQNLSQIGSTEFGLTALLGPSWYSVTYTKNDTLLSQIINPDTSNVYESPIVIIPEKCTWNVSNAIWCGAPLAAVPFTHQKDWYQGAVRSDDALWLVDPVTESATLMINPLTEVGRQIDITNYK